MNVNEDKHRYDHLLKLPHHQSTKRKSMSMTERAAQFGAFRALTGYEAAISETGRLTDRRVELDEYEKSEIDFKLRYISEHIADNPEATVTYFVPDERKEGGEYITQKGMVKKIDYYEKKIYIDEKEVKVEDIISINI